MSDEPPKKVLRSSQNVFLIEHTTHQIVGAKLPSNRQVLQVFLYNKSIGFDVITSSRLVIDEVIIFWQKARIPTSASWYSAQKIVDLHEKWKTLQKSAHRKSSELQQSREKEFSDKLDDLFDIAAKDAITTMKVEDREFLIAQRKKGREGCLIGVDVKGQEKEQKRQERIDAEERRRKKAATESASYLQSVPYDFDDFVEDEHNEEKEDEDYDPGPSQAARQRKKNIYTERLFGALDSCEITDRDAVHVISAVLAALGLSTKDYIFSHSSLGTHRSKYREKIAKEFKENAKVLMQLLPKKITLLICLIYFSPVFCEKRFCSSL